MRNQFIRQKPQLSANKIYQVNCLQSIRLEVVAIMLLFLFFSNTGIAQDETPNAVFSGHFLSVNSLCLNPAGDILISGSDDKSIRVWDTYTKSTITHFKNLGGTVNSVNYCPENDCFVSAGSNAKIVIWSPSRRDSLYSVKFKGKLSPINTICYSPDGKRVATGHEDNTVKIWNLNPKGSRLFRSLSEHKWEVNSLCYLPDGKSLISVSGDNKIVKWSEDGTIEGVFKVHSSIINSVDCYYDDIESRNLIVSGGEDRRIIISNAMSGDTIKTFLAPAPVNAVCFSPDGKYIASGGTDKVITIWKRSTGEKYTLNFHAGAIKTLKFSNTKTLYCGSEDGKISRWNLDDIDIKMFFRNAIMSEIDTSALFRPERGEFEREAEFELREKRRSDYLAQLYKKYRTKYYAMMKNDSEKLKNLTHKVSLKIDFISDYRPELKDEYFYMKLSVASGKKGAKYQTVVGNFYITRDSARSFKKHIKKAKITGDALAIDKDKYNVINVKILHPLYKKSFIFGENGRAWRKKREKAEFEDKDAKG